MRLWNQNSFHAAKLSPAEPPTPTARPADRTHVISLWDPPAKDKHRAEIDQHLQLFARVLPDAPVLTLYFDDIPLPVKGLTAPGIEHMRRVLAFACEALAERGEAAHFLVHCRMGISRSSACALAI